MGSSQMKSKSNDVADWVQNQPCGCSKYNYSCVQITLKSVPMKGNANLLIAGIGNPLFSLLAKQYYHDAIQIQIKCRNCNKVMFVTMEFSDSGKQINYGYYRRVIKQISKKIKINKYQTVIQQYNKMPNYGYNLVSFNCKHWADSLWNKL